MRCEYCGRSQEIKIHLEQPCGCNMDEINIARTYIEETWPTLDQIAEYDLYVMVAKAMIEEGSVFLLGGRLYPNRGWAVTQVEGLPTFSRYMRATPTLEPKAPEYLGEFSLSDL